MEIQKNLNFFWAFKKKIYRKFLLVVRLSLGFILRKTYRYAHHTFLLGFQLGG
jgi:hypothetical protein